MNMNIDELTWIIDSLAAILVDQQGDIFFVVTKIIDTGYMPG